MATVAQIREALGLQEDQTIQQVVSEAVSEAVSDAFEKKLSIGENVKVDLPKLERRVGDLIAVNPSAVLRDIAPVVVGRGENRRTGNAIIEGAPETWTLMRVGSQKVAIGAGHCALPYKLVRRRRDPSIEFVRIPLKLSRMVSAVCLLPDYMANRSEDDDIALLLLNDFPKGVDPNQVAEYPEDHDIARDILGGIESSVGGVSIAGNVAGRSYVKEGEQFLFVEDSSEAGMSGTLMYDTSPDPGIDPKILAVYLGTLRRWRDGKLRGRIQLLPPPAMGGGRKKRGGKKGRKKERERERFLLWIPCARTSAS